MRVLKGSKFLAVAILGIAAGTSAIASSVIFTGSLPGNELSARATFTDLAGGILQMTLANTYSGDTPDQSHVLTGVFFSGADGLSPVSAAAGAGTVEWAGTTSSTPDSSSVLGAEWEYLSGLSGAPGGATAGISSTGLGLFGHGNFAVPGDNLDGSAYGLLSAGYSGSDQDGLKANKYIQNTMVFDLKGFAGSLADISDVSFQYGTSLTEPQVTGIPIVPIPEPGPVVLLASLMGLWIVCRLRARLERV